MYIDQEELDYINTITRYGNKKGWNATEPFQVWQDRYEVV